jgi:hypothetical protein
VPRSSADPAAPVLCVSRLLVPSSVGDRVRAEVTFWPGWDDGLIALHAASFDEALDRVSVSGLPDHDIDVDGMYVPCSVPFTPTQLRLCVEAVDGLLPVCRRTLDDWTQVGVLSPKCRGYTVDADEADDGLDMLVPLASHGTASAVNSSRCMAVLPGWVLVCDHTILTSLSAEFGWDEWPSEREWLLEAANLAEQHEAPPASVEDVWDEITSKRQAWRGALFGENDS